MSEHDFPNLHMVYEQYFQADSPHPLRLKTGFSALDRVLGGGLFPGLFVLGGRPGIGKSTLALQIAAHVAENGHPVLYFSMEMPDSRVMAKAITRKIHEDAARGGKFITAELLLSRSLTEEQWAEVEAVMRTRFLEHLHICTEPLFASGILERVRAFTKQGNPPPLVVVDYLQLLPRERGAQSDKQVVDYNIYKLKELAHGQKNGPAGQLAGSPVLLLSSLNRNTYSNSYAGRNGNPGTGGSIQIGSFKETGGIEYSADLLLGLDFRAAGKRNFNPNTEMEKPIREMALTVLKNRYGKSGVRIDLQYDPAHDRFIPWSGRAGDASAPEEAPGGPQPSGAGTADQSDRSRDSGDIQVSLNITKVMNELRKGEGVGKKRRCHVWTDRETREDIYTSCSISSPLSSLDLCVADAIYTLDRLQKKISLHAVLQVLLGSKAPNLAGKRELLEASIQRLQAAELELDCEEHLARKKADAWNYKGPFLRLDGPDDRGVYHRSKTVDKIGILPLHTYGAEVQQIIRVPSVLLDVKNQKGRSMNSSTDRISLKWFLIRRLESIRRRGRDEDGGKYQDNLRIISFEPSDSLLREVCPADPILGHVGAKQIDKLYKAAQLILGYYQDIGYISDFQPIGADQGTRFPRIKIIGSIG